MAVGVEALQARLADPHGRPALRNLEPQRVPLPLPSNTSRPSALATTRLATMRIFACVLDRVCGSRLPLASAARQLRSSATPRVTKGLRLRWHHAIGCRGRLFCLNGRKRRPREIGARSRASPRHYRPSSHRLFCRGRSAARSCHRRRGSRLIPTGAPIRFAPIGWRARLPPGAGRLAAGVGGSAITPRTDYQPHSERHQRPIANAATR